jgi:hypothetical protein
MLDKQGRLFRIIVQNLHEKASDRFDTRGVEILTPASVGKEFLLLRPAVTIARQEPTAWPRGSPQTRQTRS